MVQRAEPDAALSPLSTCRAAPMQQLLEQIGEDSVTAPADMVGEGADP